MLMLTIYRRHLKNCDHCTEGRKYRRCHCPIWVDGFLGVQEFGKLYATLGILPTAKLSVIGRRRRRWRGSLKRKEN